MDRLVSWVKYFMLVSIQRWISLIKFCQVTQSSVTQTELRICTWGGHWAFLSQPVPRTKFVFSPDTTDSLKCTILSLWIAFLHLFSLSPNNPDHIKALASQCTVLDEIFTIYQKVAASHFLSYTEWIIREAFSLETSFLFLPSKHPSEKRKQQFSNIKKPLSDTLSVSGLPGLQISALPQLVLPVALTGVQAIPPCCQCTNPLPPG